MSFWAFLNQWWNLPYLVMLGLVGVYFALQTFGLVLGEHDLEQDHDLDTDTDHDLDSSSEQEHETDLAGRVPFMVVWLTLFIFAGFTGLFFNRIASSFGYRAWYFPLSLLASALTGATAVRFASRAVGKLVDTGGRGASRRSELTGAIGVVASASLDGKFGEVRVRDPRGNELIVHGRLALGEQERALPQGEKVVLVELEQDSGLFQVAALKE